MSNSLNRSEFIGNVGNIETRYTPAGQAIVSLSIACNEKWKDKQGQQQEKCTWVPISIFGKLAEIADKYVKKGDLLYIAGKFSVRKWQDKEGQDKYTTEVVVDSFNGIMKMLGGKQEQQSQRPPKIQENAYQSPEVKQQNTIINNANGYDDNFDSDIPF